VRSVSLNEELLVKRALSIAGAAALAPCLPLVLPMATADAHGYIASPPSRQAQCASNPAVLKCGAIQYEPQSVEGPKGLRSCSAGKADYAALDDDTRPWTVTTVSTNQTFAWKFTANHATANWEYYIGNTRVGFFDGKNQPAPAGVSHTLDLSKYSGRQKLLAIWNIGDTPNAFYSCVDISVGTPTTTSTTATTTSTSPTSTTATTTTTSAPPTSSTTTTAPTTTTKPPTTSTTAPTAKAWAKGNKYAIGDTVTYGGNTYRCIQAHTALDPNWTPPATPALWAKV